MSVEVGTPVRHDGLAAARRLDEHADLSCVGPRHARDDRPDAYADTKQADLIEPGHARIRARAQGEVKDAFGDLSRGGSRPASLRPCAPPATTPAPAPPGSTPLALRPGYRSARRRLGGDTSGGNGDD